ncbi:class I SAM-dependent methyltransferase [Acidobacteriota bacterium]
MMNKKYFFASVLILFFFTLFIGYARSKTFGRLDVVLEDFRADGLILDIGGGGEGIIGQLKKEQVIAIDISKRELEEAPPGPLKIIMDGRDLKFLDNSFSTTTIFFTLMYIDGPNHQQVFKEVSRILKPGGRLLIWDVLFPERPEGEKMGLFPLSITLPHKTVKTGYGVRWPEGGRDLEHYLGLAENAGFKIVRRDIQTNWFFLELEKKQ